MRAAVGPRPRAGRSGVERTRTLFFAGVLVALLIVLVPVAVLAPAAHAAAAACAALVLAASWCAGWSRARVHPLADVLDAVCLATVTALCPVPTSVLSIAFALLWFRSMYGSTRWALVRVGLVLVALAVGLRAWSPLHGGAAVSDTAAVFSGYPMMVLNVVVIRALAAGQRGRDEAAGREAVVAALGAELLAVEDPDRVRELAREAAARLCATTDGLSLALLAGEGDGLRVVRTWGAPVDLPAGPGLAAVLDAGARRGWARVPLHDPWDPAADPAGAGEVLVAGTRAAVAQGLPAVRAVVHATTMALRGARSRDALLERARTDALTGLPNRAAFHEAVGGAAPAPGGALLYVDLDGFKAVNDRLGHAAGDALLREVARRLRAVVREGDLCARLGGDEFAVLLRDAAQEEAVVVAERLVAAVREPVVLGGTSARVGASVGVAATGAAADGDELVRLADAAMYAAKGAGRGRVHVHVPGTVPA